MERASSHVAVIEEVLNASRACKYRTALMRLSEFLKSLDGDEFDSDVAFAFLIVMMGLLSSAPAETAQLLFDTHLLFRSRSTELWFVKQLALFYRSLHVDGTRAELEGLIAELEATNRQLDGRFSAGVLCAQAALYQESGEDGLALDALKRAWARSESLGGLCPAGMVVAIMASAARVEDHNECSSWLDVSLTYGQRSACCQVRCWNVRLLAAGLTGEGVTAVEVRRCLEALEGVESPWLVARCAVALLQLLVTPVGWALGCGDEVMTRISRFVDFSRLASTTAFDVRLAQFDVRAVKELDDLGLTAYRRCWRELAYRQRPNATHENGVPIGTPLLLASQLHGLRDTAILLDRRLDSVHRTRLIDARIEIFGEETSG